MTQDEAIRDLIRFTSHSEDCGIIPCSCGLAQAKSMACVLAPEAVVTLTRERDDARADLASVEGEWDAAYRVIRASGPALDESGWVAGTLRATGDTEAAEAIVRAWAAVERATVPR